MTIKLRTASRFRIAARTAVCAALLSGAGVLGLCQSANAQFAFEEEVLPPRVVAWRLADRGFTGVSRPRFDGRVYVVDAVSPTGVPVRLFVDPGMGAIVGRQRLGAPETYARLERPAPGFGWTEEDAGPRRVARPLSPEDDPTLRPQRRPAGEAMRPEPNPDGVNPDSVGRPAPARKIARVNPVRPPEKAARRVSPEAPAPKLAPAEAARTESGPDAKPETKSAAIDKAPPPNPAPTPAAKTSESTLAATSKPPAQDWKDPPADKKPVRVIGGATVVPGTAEKDQGAAQ
ncbi:hypothetical protein GOFOIKOB_0577 [Methylobacterium tardum]|uniref:hypothetical protein n=1 Tax=Methylobacterium tardum TaxID=374432 RepID=UPI00208AF407|nr:hypothetical protein GOFOIKOB_0577 [Methylobacterium tardum]